MINDRANKMNLYNFDLQTYNNFETINMMKKKKYSKMLCFLLCMCARVPALIKKLYVGYWIRFCYICVSVCPYS